MYIARVTYRFRRLKSICISIVRPIILRRLEIYRRLRQKSKCLTPKKIKLLSLANNFVNCLKN